MDAPDDYFTRYRRARFARALAELHELVESEAEPAGIRCDTEWCRAFHNHAASCGDYKGAYAGLVHVNRAERAEARDRGEPFEHGRLYADDRFDATEGR